MAIARSARNRQSVQLQHAAGGCSRCALPILIVEDQHSIASLIQALLKERFGYASIIAGTMKEALAVLASQKINLAISDLNLPDSPKGEVIDMLVGKKVATIALTGAFGSELRESMLKKGVIDYIPKQSVHSIEYAVEMAHRINTNHHTTVLVVDDSVSTLAALKHMLENMQFNVMTAGNPKEVLVLIKQYPQIRLALIDYDMPEMNGLQLIHELRKKHNKEDLAIIGISGLDAGLISAQFLKSGANDFIHKPYSYEEILCRVGQNLEMLDLIKINRDAAYKDFLTGLPNRRSFFQQAAKLHHQHKNDGMVAAMIDVDHFKKINDTYGHECGDEVLKHLADLMFQHFDGHLFARLGGEEFAVLIPKVLLHQQIELFNQFRVLVEMTPAIFNGNEIKFTVSIGLSDQGGDTIDDLIRDADKNLYAAKAAGRNRISAAARE